MPTSLRLTPLCFLVAACGVGGSIRTPGGNATPPGVGEPEDTEPPNAICRVDPDPARPLSAVRFVGEDSFDPDGIPLILHRWTLQRAPTGSAVRFQSGSQTNIDDVFLDLAGDYTATLSVTNDRGSVSDPCAVTVTAEPEHELWIELFWELPGDDLRLHVVRDDGEIFSSDDCHEGACSMSWGRPNAANEDPELLRTDADGVGPEIFGLRVTGDQFYTVYVEDHFVERSGAGWRLGSNTATINIWLDGERLFSTERTFVTFEDEGSWQAVARISASAGTATERDDSGQAPYRADRLE